MDEHDASLTIGAFARRVGLTPSALRFTLVVREDGGATANIGDRVGAKGSGVQASEIGRQIDRPQRPGRHCRLRFGRVERVPGIVAARVLLAVVVMAARFGGARCRLSGRERFGRVDVRQMHRSVTASEHQACGEGGDRERT